MGILLSRLKSYARFVYRRCAVPFLETWKTGWNLKQHASASSRMLEIGPGKERLPGFETLDIMGGKQIDYVLDATKKLPFDDDTFDVIYASHVLEHVPWFEVERVLEEWVRVLAPGGRLEIWVPDGLKICDSVLAAESGSLVGVPDGWRKRNPKDSPYIWAQGRLFWGANEAYPSWHRALFTPRYLRVCLEDAGLRNVRYLSRDELRGYDHGWINLGIVGTK